MRNSANTPARLPSAEFDSPDAVRPALFSLLESLRAALEGPADRQAVLRLRRQIERQTEKIRRIESALAGLEIFEQASAAARMGTWQCEIPSERLTWSSGTYDLFGLARNASLVRRDILKSYSEESLARLQKVRGDAFQAGEGFTLDAEIHGPEIGRRWIRISASVERRNGEPTRLFGIKQDVTEEKLTFEHMRYVAEHDVMTGLANRTQFQVRLGKICGSDGSGGALMLVDLDNFKDINDTLGHAAGDECLIEFARRLAGTCQAADLIARIGGDEFAVLFSGSVSRRTITNIAQRLVEAARFPVRVCGQELPINASIGLAFAEGKTPAALFTDADLALYAAKAAGGNSYQWTSTGGV